jgi:hypothetical protein
MSMCAATVGLGECTRREGQSQERQKQSRERTHARKVTAWGRRVEPDPCGVPSPSGARAEIEAPDAINYVSAATAWNSQLGCAFRNSASMCCGEPA